MLHIFILRLKTNMGKFTSCFSSGVLNSLELSMLSGSIGSSCREVLPTIHEERRTLSGNYGSNNDSAVLQVLEENLFKETHATNSNERDNGGSLLMKHVSSA